MLLCHRKSGRHFFLGGAHCRGTLEPLKLLCAVIVTLFSIAASNSNAQQGNQSSLSQGGPLCASSIRYSGERVQLPPNQGTTLERWEFAEYKTASSLTLRIRANTGGLSNSNSSCKFTFGEFRYWWNGEQLLPDTDLHTGRSNGDPSAIDPKTGSLRKPAMIQYFVRFTDLPPPKQNEIIALEWNERGATALSDYSTIKVLPFGANTSPSTTKVSIDKPETWYPALMLTDVRDGVGKPVVITCDGLRFKREAGRVVAVPPSESIMSCSGSFYAAPKFSGRMRVSDNSFLNYASSLTSSVIFEAASYLAKE